MPQSPHPNHDAARPTPPAGPPAAAPVVPAPDAIPFFESPTWTWPEFDPECCQECGRTIPLHETGYILGLDIVCEECHEILSALRTSRLKLLRQAAMMQRPVSRPATMQPVQKPVTTPPLAPAPVTAATAPIVETKPQPATPATNIEPAPTTIEVNSPTVQQPASIVEDEAPIPATSAPTFELTGSFIWRNHFAADVAALLTDDESIAIPTDGSPLFDEPPFELTPASFVYRACFGEFTDAFQVAETATATTASIIDDSMPLFDEPPFELTAAPFEPRACFADGLPTAPPAAPTAALIASASLENMHGSHPPADDGVTLFDEPPLELEPAAFQWRPHFADGLATTGNAIAAAATDVAHLTTTATEDGLTLFDEPPFELEPAPFEYRAHFAHELAALRCDAGLATTATDDGVTLFDEPPFELEPAPFVPRAAFATVAVDDAPVPPTVDAGMPLLDWRDEEAVAEPVAAAQAEAEVETEVPVEVVPSLEDVLNIEVEPQAEAEAPIEAALQIETEAPAIVEGPAQVVADIAAVAEVAEIADIAEVENIAAIEVAAPVDAVVLDAEVNVETSVVADVVADVEPVVDVVDVVAVDVTPDVSTAITPDEVAMVVADEAIDMPVVTTDSASDDAASVDVPTAASEIVEIVEIGEIAEIAEMAKTVEIPEVAQTDATDAINLDDEEVVAEIDDLPLEDVAPVAAPVPVRADQAPAEPTPVEQASTVEAPVEQCSIEQASAEPTPPAIAAPPPPSKSAESIMPIIDSALADSVKPIFRDKPARPSHPSLGAETPEPPPPPARLKARSRLRRKPAPPADSPLSFKHPVDALLDKLHAEQIDASVWQTLNQWRAKDRFFADVGAMLDVADDLLGHWMDRRESQDKDRKSTG